MKFADFFNEVREQGIEVSFDHMYGSLPARLSNEAMFHLPLIAITILAISKGHVKPGVEEIGQLVGDCYERTFPGFRGSAQNLGWSAALRVRTVQALAFLENANLISVSGRAKKITITETGKGVIKKALTEGSDLAQNLLAVERNYRNIRVERQLRLSPA